MIEIVLLGQPRGKERPRLTKAGHVYTPEKTRDYEAALKFAACQAMAGRAPYVVALVELPEGVRMLTSIVGDGALDVVVGDAVTVAWEPLVDGRHLPVFVRA